jgi:predicted SprT family Zn-dependent metalloprotease
MAKLTRQLKALAALNLDLFRHPVMTPPAPATLYTKITKHAREVRTSVELETRVPVASQLPTVTELQRMFDEYNWLYFNGKLHPVRIEYSTRMNSAGSYTPGQKLIKIGRKYHELFPEEVADTLKHEMIHLIHLNHDKAFRLEAKRLGTSIKARSHPSLRRPPKYVYICPKCGKEYPRQKRLWMSSCAVCCPSRFDPRYKLRLVKTKKVREVS